MRKNLMFIVAFLFITLLASCSNTNSNEISNSLSNSSNTSDTSSKTDEELLNTPLFSGYYIELERVEKSSNNYQTEIKSKKRDDVYNLGVSVITDEMYANVGEYVFITLQFINQERDTFVDLVLNDTDYGNDRVYDNFSKINKIHSVETYKSNGQWFSDITIVLPETKASNVRKIEITEVNFLKQTINKQISADLRTKSFSTFLNINVTDDYVPSSKYLFDYKKVTYDDITGYEISKINYQDYGYPSKIYFPSYIDGIPVISIGKDIVENDSSLVCKVCIIPETVKYYHTRILNQYNGTISEKLIILTHLLIDIDPNDHIENFCPGRPTHYMWDDFEHEFRFTEDYKTKEGYNDFSYIQRISLNTNSDYAIEQKYGQFELTEDGKGYIFKGLEVNSLKVIIPSEYNGLPVLHIGDYALANQYTMQYVEIPNSIITIGDSAFRSCGELTSIVIPNSVTTIGKYAFQECIGLTSINIPNSVISIGDEAFNGCWELTSITIPNSVVEIGKGMFYRCTALDVIYCEASEQPSGWDSNWNCDILVRWGVTQEDVIEQNGIQYFIKDTNVAIIRYIGADKTVTIPSTIKENGIAYNVTEIKEKAFFYCDSLISITIPNNIIKIGKDAFSNCYNLIIYCQVSSKPKEWDSHWVSWDRPVYWGVTEEDIIEQNKIQYFIKENNAVVIKYIGADTNVVIPSTIKVNGNTYNVTEIGKYAFSNCNSIVNISISNGITIIEYSAFSNCGSLTSITIPSSVTSIWEYSFSNCTSLKEIVIPSDIINIGEYAFSNCSSLTSIVFPNSIEFIGVGVLSGCTALESLTLPFAGSSKECNTHLGYIFGVDNDYVPSSLKEVIILEGCTSIGEYAFFNCDSLTSVIIPSSVTSIGYSAFGGCNSLTIYCKASEQPSGWDSRWNYNDRPIYWGNEWEYVDGVPTLIDKNN